MTERMREKTRRESVADRYSFGHKALSVVLSVVLLGFGWPAVNPSETFASDGSAQADQVQAEVAQPEETQAPEETADDSAAMALAAADEAVPVAASNEQAAAESVADKPTTASVPSASDEEEASAVEDAVEENFAVDNQGSSQAAAAQAKTEYDISLVLKNASIKKADGTNELVSLPATKVTVSAGKDFKFTVVPDSACKLNRVLVNVAGQESPPPIPDADGVYVVASSDIAKGATLTVEASSSPGNVGTVLGGVFGGGAAAASDVSGNAGETTSAKVGDKVTLKGTSNKNCSYAGEWTVKKNGESTSAGTVKGNGGSATAVFSEAGTFEIEHAYCEALHFLGFGDHSVKTETFTVVVQPATPARSISISGSDTVTQFSNIQLTATVDPAEATGTYEWSSSNEDILTVDNSGNVTGVRQGTATVTVSFISAVGSSEVSASKDVTVTATKDATDQALVYYLLDPTKDANSNDSGHWGKTSLGTAMVNTTGATWAGGKNCFDNVDQRVVSWPNGTNVVPRDSDAWDEIFDNYKTTIQAQLPGVTFTKDDVEEIALVPAKISKNNGTDPDMHLDCNVSIKCKNVALVKYYLRDAGSTQFEQKGARNYISGNATQPSDVMNEQFPETKTVDGVTYTFSGWYLDQSFTQPATFPYTVNSSTNFYAKYVGGFRVAYDLAGGSWNNSDATTYIAQEGSTQTVKSEPTREGYKFTGWTIEGLPDTTALKSGDTFAMPAGNVTITANWQELLSYRVKYLEKGTEKQLADPDTRYGEQGEKVSADAKTIDGYHLADGCSSHIEKTLGSSDNDITFWYEKDSVEYTVNYCLNGTEQKVADSETKSAPWDTQVKASDLAKGIDGYTAVPNQATTITVNRDGKSYINVYYYQNVDLVANSDAKTYNGSGQSASGFTGAPEDADFSGITVGANGTDAGTYPAQFAEGTVGTIDKTEKYIVASVENGSLVIGKAEVTLKSADLSKKYDGTALKNGDNALETESGFVEGEGATYAFTGSQTVVGSSPNAFDYTLNEGTKADNYTITKSEGTLKVTDRDETEKYEITVTANSATETYDGTEKTVSGVTGTTLTNDKGATFTVEGLSATVSGTDAGEYTNEVSGTPVVKDAAGNDVTSQFKVKTVNGKLVIDKRAVTIKPKDATKAYDGEPLKATEWEVVSGSFVDGQSIANPQYDGSQTVPGSSESSITEWDYAEGTNADNYNITAAKGSLTVTDRADGEKYEITVTANSAEFSYDGNEHAVEGFETLEFPVDGNKYTVSGLSASVSGTDAGTYPNNVTGTAKVTDAAGNDVTSQFSVTTESGSLVINKAKATIAPKDATKAYDGTDLKASEFVTEGFVKDQGVKSAAFTGSQLNVGTSKSGIDGYVLADGTNANNYDITKGTGNLEVTPVSDEVTVTITGNAATLKYDGTEQSVTAYTVACSNGLYTANDFDFTGAAVAKGTNVGTYKMGLEADQFSNTSANFTNVTFAVENDGSLTISPREVVLASDSAEKSYDGTALTKNEQSNVKVSGDGFVDGEGASFDITGSQTNAGSSKNTFTYSLNEGTQSANYEITQFEGDLTVNAITSPVVVTIVGDTKQATYDGEEHTAEGYTFTSDNELYTQDKVDFSGEAKAHRTDAGTTTMGLEDQFANADTTNFKNVTFKVTDGFVQVDKAQVTLKSADLNKKYDGTALKNGGTALETESGFAKGEGATYTFTGSQTVVGSSPNAFDYTLNEGTNADNYTITKSEGTLTVTNRDAKYEIEVESNSAEFTYDGNEHMAEGFKTLEFPVDGNEYTVSGLSASVARTDAGTYSNAITGTAKVVDASGNDVSDQFSVTTKNGSLVIKQASVHMKSASDEWVYDGNEHAKHEMESVTGFAKDEGATYSYTGAITNAGTVQNMFTYTLNEGTKASNYTFDGPEYGTLKVTPVSDEVTVTIKGNTATKTYDGTEKTVSGYDFSASNELYKNTDFEFTGNNSVSATNVGTYGMELKSEDFKNTNGNFSKVTFVVVDGQLTITPKSVDPEAGKGMSVGKLPNVTYNGKSQKQKPEVKDGNTLLTEGADYTLSYSKDTTNVGTVTVTVEGKGNYAGEAEVTYEIMKRQVALESASASKVYDGTPLTKPEVTVGGDGFVEGEVSGLKAIGTVTNVADGEVDNEIVWDWAEGFGEGNYDITKTEGKLSIEPQSVDPDNPESYTGIKVGELSDLPYKGKDQFQEPMVTDAKGNLLVKDCDYTLAFDGDAKNVTDAGVSVTVSGIGNYKGDFSRSYKILPREVTVKSASASKVYDGTPLFSHDVVVTSAAGFVEYDVASMTAPNSITEVGSLTNEIAIEWSNDIAAGNYVVLKEEGVLEVTPKSVTAEGFSVEGLNDVTYNGLAQQQEPTVKDGDKTLTKDKDYTLSFTEDVTNVGTVRVTVTGKGNYTGSADVAYQILPAKLIVTTPSDSMVYNGKPLTAEGSIEGFVNNETAVFETTGSQTEVGESENTYAIHWSDEGTTAKRSNYTVEEHIGTLTVTEYADEIVAVANDVTMTYDGMPHRAEVTVTGVPEGYSVKTAWSGAEATDVTGADGLVANVDEIVVVNAEGKDVTNSLKITKKPGKLVIEPKELTVVTMGASKPYDGTPLTANGKIEGFVNGETAAFAVIGSQTEVGECTNAYTIEWSGNAKQGNYTVKEELGKLEVTKSQAAIVIVPKGGKKTYDGTPLVSEGADAYGLPAGFTCEATTKGSVTNVGSAVAEIDTYAIKNADGKDVTDQFGNVSTGFATLLVTKRPVTVVSEDASKVYDGTPLTKHKAGVTEGSMVDGESFVYEFTGTQTVVGESANSFMISAGDGTNLDNYEITKQDGTLKVEPKGVVPGEDNGMKVTKPVDKVYNGKEQKFVPVVTDGEKVLVENVDYAVTYTDALDFEGDAAAKDDFTNVTGDIFVTVEGIGNYTGSLTQSYQITPKPYTVTTVSGSKVYDGTPLEGASLEGNFVGGLVNNDDATFVVTGTQTEVGVSDNTYTLEFVDEQMAKNYKLVKEDIGTLTVVKDESEASQNSNGNGESKNKGALPKTGDMTLATLPFALAVVAGAVLCVAPVARRRSKF